VLPPHVQIAQGQLDVVTTSQERNSLSRNIPRGKHAFDTPIVVRRHPCLRLVGSNSNLPYTATWDPYKRFAQLNKQSQCHVQQLAQLQFQGNTGNVGVKLVAGRQGLQGSETSRFPHCLDIRLTDGGTGRALLPIKIPGTHFCQRLSKPQGLARLEGLGKLKQINSPHRVSNPRPSACSTVRMRTNVRTQRAN
jgi:hypothetical protein